MKRNYILILLVIVSLLAIAFGYIQMRQNSTNQSKVVELERLYNEMKQSAEEQRQLAERQKKQAEYLMARYQECEKRLVELK